MRYFCSYSYRYSNHLCFGCGTLETEVDPYDNIDNLIESLKNKIRGAYVTDVVLLFYKRVKS